MGKNPSLGVMEIYQNSRWQKLCTSSWDKKEENLTCNAMGYSNDGVHGNGKWHTDNNNSSNASIHYNCTTLTKCGNNINNKVQLCKGISYFPSRLDCALCILTNRFHFAVHLFSYRSQMTSKCGKNISDPATHLAAHGPLFCSHHISTSSVIYFKNK